MSKRVMAAAMLAVLALELAGCQDSSATSQGGGKLVQSGVQSVTICSEHHARIFNRMSEKIPGIDEGVWGGRLPHLVPLHRFERGLGYFEPPFDAPEATELKRGERSKEMGKKDEGKPYPSWLVTIGMILLAAEVTGVLYVLLCCMSFSFWSSRAYCLAVAATDATCLRLRPGPIA